MKKIFLSIVIFCLLAIIFVPILAEASIVPPCGPVCTTSGGKTTCTGEPCGINDFFKMLGNILKFIVETIATPLAVIALIIGGVMMMISAGNPNLFGTGKKIMYAAIIGLVLVFCSRLIIKFILDAIGAKTSNLGL